jgi:hypothetical protein
MKSRGNPEVHSSWRSQRIRSFGETWRFADGTTGWCANRGDSGIHQPVPEGSGFGATRGTDHGDTERTGKQGNLWIGQSAPPKDASFGATRRSIAGKAGDAGERGNPEACIRGAERGLRNRGDSENQESGSAEGCEIRGNSKIHRRHSQRTKMRGNPEIRHPARPKDAGYGATRRRKTSQAGRCRGRGNSEPASRG